MMCAAARKQPEGRDVFSFCLFNFKYCLQISPRFFFLKNTRPYNKSNAIKTLQMNTRSHSLLTPIFFRFLFTPQCASAEPLADQFSYRRGSFGKVFQSKSLPYCAETVALCTWKHEESNAGGYSSNAVPAFCKPEVSSI